MADKDRSPFAYIDRYPEIDVFFNSVSEKLSENFEASLVVLDTSALMLPFKADSASLNKIGEVYKYLQERGRLFVPAHAIREYMVNREDRVKDLHQSLVKLESKSYNKSVFPMLSDDPQYENFIVLQDGLLKAYRELKQIIGELEEKVRDWRWNDPITQLYINVFSKDVIFNPELDEIALEEDLSRRLRLKIPPGYKDGKKDDNSAGDLIIWHTILKLAEREKKPIIFISGDRKNDWWTQSSGPLHPRFELLQEFKRYSDNKPIFFITLPELLRLMNVKQSVIQDISEISENNALNNVRDIANKSITLSKDRVEIYHLHTAKFNIDFRSAKDIAGKIIKLDLSVFPVSVDNYDYIELITKELDFSDLDPKSQSVSREVSIYAFGTPGLRRQDNYSALTDLFSITASADGRDIGFDTIIIEEKLLDVECSINPSEFIVDSFSEVVFTLQVEMYPPPESIIPIRLGYPVAGPGLAIEHRTSETRLENGILMAEVTLKLGELPEHFFEGEIFDSDSYIVEVGDALGYRKAFYWNTTVDITFGPFRKSK